jgi:hypothetical protein
MGRITINRINFYDPDPTGPLPYYTGIFAHNTGHLDIIDNRIENYAGSIPQHLAGIFLRRVYNNSLLCNNWTLHCDRGIEIHGPLLGTQVRQNKMYNNFAGFSLDNFGNIGPQGDPISIVFDNEWDLNTWDSYSNNSSNVAQLTFFYTRNPINPYGIVTMFRVPPSNFITSPVTISAPVVTDCHPPSPYPQTPTAQAAIQYLDSDTVSTAEQKWLTKHQLYEWILSDTTVDANDSIVSAFMDTVYNEPTGIAHRVNDSIAKAYADTAVYLPDSLTIALAIALNNTIDTTFHMDKNFRKLMNIYLNNFASGNFSFSSPDSTFVADLAFSCMNYEGPMVTTARTMRDIANTFINDTLVTVYNDSACIDASLPNLFFRSYSVAGNCRKSNVEYSCNSVDSADSYTWTVPSGATITSGQGDTLITVDFDSTFTSGTICVTAEMLHGQNASGCVNVFAIPETPGEISGPLYGVCSGVDISYSIEEMESATEGYTWTVPSGCITSPGLSIGSIQVSFPDTFISGYITVWAVNECGNGWADSILVYGKPATPSDISCPDDGFCSGGLYTFTTDGSEGATYYNWSVPDDATIIGRDDRNSILVELGSSSGIVTVSATNDCGTSDTATFEVIVIECRQAGHALINSHFKSQVFPNPAREKATIAYSINSDGLFNVYDMYGSTDFRYIRISIRYLFL